MRNRSKTGVFEITPLEWRREGECIICTSHKPDNYGYFQVHRNNGKKARLHRVVAGRRFGNIERKVVRHTCDNPACINPNHLITGSQNDNIQDSVARGRNAKGSKNGQSKVTEEMVIAIRSDGGRQADIAIRFGITQPTVSAILNRSTWRHV